MERELLNHADDEYWFDLWENNRQENVYPFEDGDTYYTIEDNEVIESTWDFVSEEIFDEDIHNTKGYFKRKEDAEAYLRLNIQ